MAEAEQRTFAVPAENAVDAIPQFAQQAGIQVITSADQIHGVKTQAVSGNIDTRIALKKLLVGTGLEVASDDGQIIVLRSTAKNVQAAQNEGAASSDNPDQSDAVETVVVSSSRLSGVGLDLPTPTSVIARSDLDQGNGPTSPKRWLISRNSAVEI